MSNLLGPFAASTYGRLTQLKGAYDSHAAATSAHSATSAATASRIILRDSNGRANVVSPAASDNSTLIATTAWVQGELGAGGYGTVTNVATGTGLTGGPITTTGTISLANTAVVAGSYTLASITVDAQGRITSAANGSAVTSITGNSPLTKSGTTSVTLGIQAATTGQNGYMSSTDKSKLDNIEAGAQVNDVTTVFGRTGAVVATTGDYTIQKISGVTISTSGPAGGADGDVHFQY